MALTYRSEKGSALTITELDDNFRYFTGSHAITGSLVVSGSIIPADSNGTLGTADNPWKSLYVDNGTIYLISGSESGSISWTEDGGFNMGPTTLSGSNSVDGSLTVSGSLTISGSNTLTNIGPFNNTGSIYVTEDVTAVDVNIDDWGSVSASLASISTPDIQAVTIAGNEFMGGLSIINGNGSSPEADSPYNGGGIRFRTRPFNGISGYDYTGSIGILNNGQMHIVANGAVVARFGDGTDPGGIGIESLNYFYSHKGAYFTGSLTVSGSDPGQTGTALSTIKFQNLPTDESTVASGQLWLSGSAGTSSKVLCVKD